MVLQLRKDQLLGIHRSKSEVPPELLPPFTVGWGEGVDDRYVMGCGYNTDHKQVGFVCPGG